MDGMVLIGHRSSESTSGASKTEKFCNSHFQGLHNISLAEASCTERVSEVLFFISLILVLIQWKMIMYSNYDH